MPIDIKALEEAQNSAMTDYDVLIKATQTCMETISLALSETRMSVEIHTHFHDMLRSLRIAHDTCIYAQREQNRETKR